MREVSSMMLKAIRQRKSRKCSSNTTVEVSGDKAVVLLFNNRIIEHKYGEGDNYISDCGWPTKTTHDRLNAYMQAFYPSFSITARQNNSWLLHRSRVRRDPTDPLDVLLNTAFAPEGKALFNLAKLKFDSARGDDFRCTYGTSRDKNRRTISLTGNRGGLSFAPVKLTHWKSFYDESEYYFIEAGGEYSTSFHLGDGCDSPRQYLVDTISAYM